MMNRGDNIMAKYIKKAIPVEAEIYKKGMEDGFDNDKPYVKTLEGKMYISQGDYIIIGVEGERYPCKPNIFKKTYTLIE